MKTCGIIVEYNPMHKGHIYHLQQAKKLSGCDILIVVLSSYFTQRALPSLIDPYTKTKLAIEHGANIVIELPSVYAAQSADHFARFAIETLANMNVDCICFGSETNSISQLETLGYELEKLEKDQTTSWQKNIARKICPNDILGIQYIKYAKEHHIVPICIQRDQTFKSATQTRKDYFSGEEQFLDDTFLSEQQWSSYYPYLRLFLCMSEPKDLEKYHLVTEGIQYRLIKNAKLFRTWEQFLEASVSKTYTRARIQRTCLFLMLQITKQEMKENDHFNSSILLGFDSIGQTYLNEIKKEQTVFTKFSQLPPFLKKVHLKSKLLYESVLNDPVKEGVYVG
ncbi:hypothetical protein C815_01125 [Firmicutes bacterium M10-2]|nr:hypothetical protein C815_01125 [Firmicutes bacterium M10-2]